MVAHGVARLQLTSSESLPQARWCSKDSRGICGASNAIGLRANRSRQQEARQRLSRASGHRQARSGTPSLSRHGGMISNSSHRQQQHELVSAGARTRHGKYSAPQARLGLAQLEQSLLWSILNLGDLVQQYSSGKDVGLGYRTHGRRHSGSSSRHGTGASGSTETKSGATTA